MPLTTAQRARNRYAALISAGAPASEIEQARADLEYAKAEAAITSWARISLERRARLAARLLAADSAPR